MMGGRKALPYEPIAIRYSQYATQKTRQNIWICDKLYVYCAVDSKSCLGIGWASVLYGIVLSFGASPILYFFAPYRLCVR